MKIKTNIYLKVCWISSPSLMLLSHICIVWDHIAMDQYWFHWWCSFENFVWKISRIRTSMLASELFVFVFLKKKNIVIHFSIIYKSNKCFIISISNSSNVLKISPPPKKKKPNKHTPQATTKLILINCFLNIVNNS